MAPLPNCVAINGNPHGVRWDEGIDTTGWDPRGSHVYDPNIEATDSTTLPKRKRCTVKEQLDEVNGVVTPSKVAPGGAPVQEEWNSEGFNLRFTCPICEMRFNAKSKLEKHFLKCVKTNGNPLGLRCDEEWEEKCKEDFIQAYRSRQRILHPNRATTTHSTHNSSLEPDSEADDQSTGPSTRRRREGKRNKRRRVEISEVPEAEPSIPQDPVPNPPDYIPDDVWERAFQARPFSAFRINSLLPKSQWDAHERFLNNFPTPEARADDHAGLQSNILPTSTPNPSYDTTSNYNQSHNTSNSGLYAASRSSLPLHNTPQRHADYYNSIFRPFNNPTGPSQQPTVTQPAFRSAYKTAPYGGNNAPASTHDPSYDTNYSYEQEYNAPNPSPYSANGFSLPLHRAPQRHPDYYNPVLGPFNTPAGPPYQATAPQPPSSTPHSLFSTYASTHAGSYHGSPHSYNFQPIPPQTQTAPDTRHPSHPLSDEDPAINAQSDSFLGVGWQTSGLSSGSQAPTTGAPALDSRPQTLGHGGESQFPTTDEAQRRDFPGSSMENLASRLAPQNTNTSLFNLDNASGDRNELIQRGELPDWDSY